MSPASKRAAGKGVVGYIRVSAAGQREGWSLESQAQAIRAWAKQHDLPLIAIEDAPDGHESDATAFDDRLGWQRVEAHIATGKVGWIAVAAFDRLSRDLGALVDQVRRWQDLDIAVVAPAQGSGDLQGIGSLFLHLHGAISENERKRLLARVLTGLEARFQAGLPLGTQPYGYREVIDATDPGKRQRSQVRLEPDPATGPVVTTLFAQAIAQPSWGDRRMATWAKVQFPGESWSPGRIANLLANPVVTGVLRVRLLG